ncbi:hypothetical protein BU23DRAFT_206982 [Bimuria novae-zelandiae CBS 107.79]|uniref:Uncharacterized protein n=1 Tax=Bimuria novae-zelandiae CBS 107.79 TaxID=1447943 RepID=A0A6A5VBV3_9PLEO|nr:hypothetical protein BU23DRAFT_206982 [Bimuria novae-zelandiae CBS 107.79]
MPLSLPYPETCSVIGSYPSRRLAQCHVHAVADRNNGIVASRGCQGGVSLELMDARYLGCFPCRWTGQRDGPRGSPHSSAVGTLLNHVPCLDRPGLLTNEISSATCFCCKNSYSAVKA